VGSVCAYTCIRIIGDRAHPLISVNYYSFLATVISFLALMCVPSIGFQLPADFREWALLLSLGVSGYFLQYLFTAGMQYDKSSRATNMMYTSMIFALGLDKLIWGIVPGWTSIIGSALILGSTLFVALRMDPAKVAKKSEADIEVEYGLIDGMDSDDEVRDDERTVRG